MTPKKVLALCREKDVKAIDLRFMDFPGLWQHFTIPAGALSEDVFESGLGFEAARRQGSEVHAPIQYDPALVDTPKLGFTRPSNNAGGLEAGMTNSQPIVIRAAKKPISTLAQPLESVNLGTLKPETAAYERSDVCAIAAASCIVENVVAFEVACALVDKFGGDSLAEMKARWELFHRLAREKLEGGE